jgi:CO dehydrogenase/acetyl-CoA synthase delta subunit
MSVKSFTIGGVQYNAAMASAVDQDRLLSILSASLLERALTAAKSGVELDNDVLMPMFMAMPQQIKTQVAEVLMGKVVINGGDRAVSVADFGGKLVHYNQLLAELLRWNLSDFFDWLPNVLAGEKAAPQVA